MSGGKVTSQMSTNFWHMFVKKKSHAATSHMSTPKDQTSDLVELTPSKRLSGLIHSTGSLASPTFEHCKKIYWYSNSWHLSVVVSSLQVPCQAKVSHLEQKKVISENKKMYHLCHPMLCNKHIPCCKIPAIFVIIGILGSYIYEENLWTQCLLARYSIPRATWETQWKFYQIVSTGLKPVLCWPTSAWSKVPLAIAASVQI